MGKFSHARLSFREFTPAVCEVLASTASKEIKSDDALAELLPADNPELIAIVHF